MFSNGNNGGYSLSDIAAVSGNGNGLFGGGDGGAWWIIILFLFCFMGWSGNGFGNNGTASTVAATTAGYDAALSYGLDLNNIKSGITDGFYAVNTGMLNGFANTNSNISNSAQNI